MGNESYWERKSQFDVENSRRICRQACLNTAVETINELSRRGKINGNIHDVSDDVITLAGKYEEWVLGAILPRGGLR